MLNDKPAILLTGHPGAGKTTAVRKILELTKEHCGGFYTREVLSNDSRVGFEIITLDGETVALATKNQDISFAAEITFGAYKVNLDAINVVAVPSIERAVKEKRIVVIDEIGPMEIFSEAFRKMVMTVLNLSNVLVFGTIVERPNPFADLVKAHPRAIVKTITIENREELTSNIYLELRKYL